MLKSIGKSGIGEQSGKRLALRDIHLKKLWEKRIPVILWEDVSGPFGGKDQDDET